MRLFTMPWVMRRPVGWTTMKANRVTPICHLVADDIAGNDGDAVASWTDRIGGYVFSQAAPAKQPALKKAANGINGHNVVRFDGGDLLRTGTIFDSGQVGVVIAVYKIAVLQDSVLFGSCDEATDTHYLRFYSSGIKTGNFYMRIFQNDGGAFDAIRGDTIQVINTPYLGEWLSDGAVWRMRRSGHEEGITVTDGANAGDWFGDTSSRDNFTVGACKQSMELYFFRGDLAELRVYAALDAAQLASIEAELAATYAIVLAPFLGPVGPGPSLPERIGNIVKNWWQRFKDWLLRLVRRVKKLKRSS